MSIRREAWNVWAEGHSAQGSESQAVLLSENSILADSFDQAVEMLKDRHCDASYFRRDPKGQWRFWGCRLFPDEASARRCHG